jgi:hypothetical protein
MKAALVSSRYQPKSGVVVMRGEETWTTNTKSWECSDGFGKCHVSCMYGWSRRMSHIRYLVICRL